MERDDRAPVASFFAEHVSAEPGAASLDEQAAHHARVKRLEVGDAIRIVDGKGRIARGAIETIRRDRIDVALESINAVPPLPSIHVRVPVGDRDRMLWLAEKATELGVASWQAVRFRRSMSVSPRGEGASFAAKVRARMIGALEQSGGAWLPRILPDVGFEELSFDSDDVPLLLDADGVPLASIPLPRAFGPVILFGPEGGVEPLERESLLSRGWKATRVAPLTLRFETAGLAAVAVCRNLQMLGEETDGR